MKALEILSIKAEITKRINYDDVIDDFATIQEKKENINKCVNFINKNLIFFGRLPLKEELF